MGASSFVYESEFLAKGARAEEEDHDEGVGEADFGTVNGTIAHGFEEGEIVGILRIEDDLVYGVLHDVRPVVGIVILGND